MAPHSSTLAWKIPWMEEPGRLQSMGWLRVRHNWVTSLSLFTFMHWRRKWQPTPGFLPGESQGGKPGGLPSMGSHRIGHDWSDLAAAAAAVAQMENNLPAMRETQVQFLGQEAPLEKGIATHSSIPAWVIPWDREAWWVTAHGNAKSKIQLSHFHFTYMYICVYTHTHDIEMLPQS